MTLPEIGNHVVAGNADVREDTHVNGIARDHETLWIARVVSFRERGNAKGAYRDRGV